MLKENIEHKEGMPIDQFKLIFNGQQMEEVKKLTDYKISPGSSIIMVPSLRGGWLVKLIIIGIFTFKTIPFNLI